MLVAWAACGLFNGQRGAKSVLRGGGGVASSGKTRVDCCAYTTELKVCTQQTQRQPVKATCYRGQRCV